MYVNYYSSVKGIPAVFLGSAQTANRESITRILKYVCMHVVFVYSVNKIFIFTNLRGDFKVVFLTPELLTVSKSLLSQFDEQVGK